MTTSGKLQMVVSGWMTLAKAPAALNYLDVAAAHASVFLIVDMEGPEAHAWIIT